MCVLYVYEHVSAMCVNWHLQIPEECTGAPGTGVKNDHEACVVAGNLTLERWKSNKYS